MSNSVIILRISLAILVGTIIGIEREIKNRPAGMRTHILVCLGACIISLIESYFSAGITGDTSSSVAYNFGRLSAQVVSGIGFLGAGTIPVSYTHLDVYKRQESGTPMTTSACTGCSSARNEPARTRAVWTELPSMTESGRAK